MKLTVATAYFPVAADIRKNLKHVLKQMKQAKKNKADVIHFPECCLSGYAGTDFTSYRNFDWSLLKESSLRIVAEARNLGLWTILGSTHRLASGKKPFNSVYIISRKNHREI